jgi:hypothetical protein
MNVSFKMGRSGWSISVEDRDRAREQMTNDDLKTILIFEGLEEQGVIGTDGQAFLFA